MRFLHLLIETGDGPKPTFIRKRDISVIHPNYHDKASPWQFFLTGNEEMAFKVIDEKSIRDLELFILNSEGDQHG